jgi:hypothetical protein
VEGGDVGRIDEDDEDDEEDQDDEDDGAGAPAGVRPDVGRSAGGSAGTAGAGPAPVVPGAVGSTAGACDAGPGGDPPPSSGVVVDDWSRTTDGDPRLLPAITGTASTRPVIAAVTRPASRRRPMRALRNARSSSRRRVSEPVTRADNGGPAGR